MPSFASPFPRTTVFELSAHAELRVLERTGVAGGQLLSYLQTGLCVWLDEVGFDRTRYALLHSPGADAFYVVAVSGSAVLKTVLTLEMYEQSRCPMPPIWRVLLRMLMAQRLAPSTSPAPALPRTEPSQESPTPSVAGIVWSMRLNHPGAASVELGTLGADALVQAGLPGLAGPVRRDLRSRWGSLAHSTARSLLTFPENRRWLLQCLDQHADHVADAKAIGIVLSDGRLQSRWVDVSAQVSAALQLKPSALDTGSLSKARVDKNEQELALPHVDLLERVCNPPQLSEDQRLEFQDRAHQSLARSAYAVHASELLELGLIERAAGTHAVPTLKPDVGTS